MKKNYWNFILRSDEDLHKELESLAKKYSCTLQDMVKYLIQIGLINLQSKELYIKANDIKKFLEEHNLK